MNFLRKFLSSDVEISKNEYSEYLDLDKFEKDMKHNLKDEEIKRYIKIVIFSNKNQIQLLRKELYNNNILIVDISIIKNNEELRDQFLKELKEVVSDINGDIVGIKNDLILISPAGIAIDRKKIGGNL